MFAAILNCSSILFTLAKASRSIVIAFGLALGLTQVAFAQRTNDAGASLKSHWAVAAAHPFYDGDKNGLGFSLNYDKRQIGTSTMSEWKISSEVKDGVAFTTFRHPSGLVIIREARPFAEFEAVEYTLRFKNESDKKLPAISNVNALNLTFGGKLSPNSISVLSAGGGLNESAYPPATFAVKREYLGAMTEFNSGVRLGTEGGRSSNRDMPFFFVDNKTEKAGVFVAIGWTGQWRANIAANFKQQELRLTGGIPDINISLLPGEEISSPRILLGCYRGELVNGSNRLRRLIREHYTPTLEGKKPEPFVIYDHWWNIELNFDEKLLRRLADTASELKQDYFLIDAGWYEGTKARNHYSAGVGNWDEPDKQKFPSGMRAFADYVRAKNMKFGLWLEPENASDISKLAHEHPDWIINLPEGATPDPPFVNPQRGLLDFGKPEVQAWACALFDKMISEYGIGYIRYDFNIDPLVYWNSKDAVDRRGITQIRHIEGFYKVIDYVREHHPNVVLDGCASGGRRLDLETVRRFHTMWISDTTDDPHLVRYQLSGINYFLPGNYNYMCFTLPPPHQKNLTISDHAFHSFFSGTFGYGGRIDEWSPQLKERARKHVEIYNSIKRFLLEDYYPLAVQPRDLESWEAVQFHDPKTSEGFVLVFRHESVDLIKNLKLKGLDVGARYTFKDPYTNESFQSDGATLLESGRKFELPPMSSKLLVYRRENIDGKK